MHGRKWPRQAKNFPLALVIGLDPVLPAVSAAPIPMEVDVLEVMGALRGNRVNSIVEKRSTGVYLRRLELALRKGSLPICLHSRIDLSI
jgi:UbiD family decarboxylase